MRYVALSEKARPSLTSYLEKSGHGLISIRSTGSVYEAVSSHADIYLCRVGNQLIIAPEELVKIEDQLIHAGLRYRAGTSVLAGRYPNNIAYNAAVTGKYLIHNLAYTDKALLAEAEKQSLTLIHVKQGYTKCNCVIVTDDAIITSDQGIARQLSAHPIDVLLIHEGHVGLTGFSHGFLGGASGRIDGSILFNGNLALHPDFESIRSFIESKGLAAVFFADYPLEDIGSIIGLA